MASVTVTYSTSFLCLFGSPLETPRQKSPRQSNLAPFSGNGSPRWDRSRSTRRLRAKSAEPEQHSENAAGPSPSTSFLSVLCPLLRLFSGGDPSEDRNETLEIFEFEACPFCRRVREAMTELDLSVEIYPCPKGSARHRAMVRELGGKEQFPFMMDPNTGISMYESGDIVKYLFEKYGNGRTPSSGLLESTLITGWMPTILRAGRGMALWEKAKPDPPPEKLELFSYENNPYARIVREALCELELPYILQNVGEGSPREKLLIDISGSKEVPFIVDLNTGTRTGDYRKILSYLFQTYTATAAAP